MARKSTRKTDETEVESHDKLDPPPPRVGSLKTHDKLLLEMQRVYRDMRLGRIRPADGSKLVFVLGMMAKTIDAVELREIEDDSSSIERLIEIFAAGRAAKAKEAAAAADPSAPLDSIENAIDAAMAATEPEPQEHQVLESEQEEQPTPKRRFFIPGIKRIQGDGNPAYGPTSSGIYRALESITKG